MFTLFKRIPSISTRELQDKGIQKLELLDVRTPSEYRSGHISKAKNVPLNKVENYTGAGKDELYVICQSGMRSKQAVRKLRKNGYHAINVRGGMNQWAGSLKG